MCVGEERRGGERERGLMVFSGVCDLGRFPSPSTDVVNVNVFESHPALQHIRFLHPLPPPLPSLSSLPPLSSPPPPPQSFSCAGCFTKISSRLGPITGRGRSRLTKKSGTTYPHSSSVLQRKQACSLKAPSVDLTRPTCFTSRCLREAQYLPPAGKLHEPKNLSTLLDLCVSSLGRGHVNLLCVVPNQTDGRRWES